MADLSNPNLSHTAKRGLARDTDIPIWFLIACFILDPASPSGLRWRERPREHFSSDRAWRKFNAQFAGTPAGTLHRGWRVVLTVSGGRKQSLGAHRIIFALTHSRWPTVGIDHIDHKPASNQITNLREATQGQNNQNASLRSDNTSGFKGVKWHTQRRKWMVFI